MPRPEDLDERALLDLVQRQTLRYFWDFAHPACGLARERSNRGPDYGPEVVTTGGSGFGVMAIITGVARGWIGRAAASSACWPWSASCSRPTATTASCRTSSTATPAGRSRSARRTTAATSSRPRSCWRACSRPASTSTATGSGERASRPHRPALGGGRVELATAGCADVLYWHWSPNHGWSMNLEVRGWNECLLAYVLAASAPRHPIDPEVYHRGWAAGRDFRNGREFYGIRLPLGPDYGGPLFFAHYSFLGLDPRGLKDRYADYWEQNVPTC